MATTTYAAGTATQGTDVVRAQLNGCTHTTAPKGDKEWVTIVAAVTGTMGTPNTNVTITAGPTGNESELDGSYSCIAAHVITGGVVCLFEKNS